MTKIALLRHYPTAWNREQRLQGRSDIPLTEEARAALGSVKLPAPWDRARIISSPLKRARETAELLSNGRRILTDARFVEMSWGTWEGKLAKDLLADPSQGFRPTHEWDWQMRAPDGESAEDAWTRVKPALAKIAQHPDTAVVVMHKALMRLILGIACAWQGMPEIKRGRLYPLSLRVSGQPSALAPPVRLEAV